ncbi:MAG TPA: cell division protein CrgA [Acidimicrobiales bacterium]|nr:cell division protein CrgA [Acidimicrobiales bacterium]
MARKTKDAPGRVTPKGTTPRSGSRTGTVTSGRYTAPIPREVRSSPWWVPAIMLALFGLGVICILLNYVGVLPGGASNVYLLVGLALIIAGFIVATRYH